MRSVVTDATGQCQIVNLPPGAYTLTFTLAGFNTLRRDGVEVTGPCGPSGAAIPHGLGT